MSKYLKRFYARYRCAIASHLFLTEFFFLILRMPLSQMMPLRLSIRGKDALRAPK